MRDSSTAGASWLPRYPPRLLVRGSSSMQRPEHVAETRDLLHLASLDLEVDPGFLGLQLAAGVLTPYAVDVRYIRSMRVTANSGMEAIRYAEQIDEYVFRH